MKRTSNLSFLLVLSAYILLQFCWWGYLLITGEANNTWMIVGEGSVFLAILIFGISRLYKSMKRERSLHRRQSNFLLSVTHELKTPLASVQLILQTMMKRSLPEDQLKAFSEKALDENKKSQELIENILQAASLEDNNIVLNKNPLVPSVFFEKLKNRFESKGMNELIVRISEDQAFLADAFLLEIILSNLIENSYKYGATKVTVDVLRELNWLKVKLSDNGVGINAADQPFIFEKFYRSGDENIREKTGTGLGLYIAYEFARLQGGDLTFAPMDKGSIFTLSLPYGK